MYSVKSHSAVRTFKLTIRLRAMVFKILLQFWLIIGKGHVTQSNFSCNLQPNDGRIKNLSSCRGVSRLQLFSQLATCVQKQTRWRAKDELWLAYSDKIVLQVAEGMLHASNLSCNLADVEGRSTFLATCNIIIAVAKFVALQVARKIALCNMALLDFMLSNSVCYQNSWLKWQANKTTK